MSIPRNPTSKLLSLLLALGMAFAAAALSLLGSLLLASPGGVLVLVAPGLLIALAVLDPTYVPPLAFGTTATGLWAVSLHLFSSVGSFSGATLLLATVYFFGYWMSVRQSTVHPIAVSLLPILSALGTFGLAALLVRPTFPPEYWDMPVVGSYFVLAFLQFAAVLISSIAASLAKLSKS